MKFPKINMPCNGPIFSTPNLLAEFFYIASKFGVENIGPLQGIFRKLHFSTPNSKTGLFTVIKIKIMMILS